MKLAVVTTARLRTIGAAETLRSSLERWWPEPDLHVLLAASIEQGPRRSTPWPLAEVDDTPYMTPMILHEADQLALVLPRLLHRLLEDYEACLVLQPGHLVVRPFGFGRLAPRSAGSTIILPAPITRVDSLTPAAERAALVRLPTNRTALLLTRESSGLIADWSSAVTEAVVDIDQPRVTAVGRSFIRNTIGRADVAIEGQETLLLWHDYAAVESGQATGPRASIIDCRSLLESVEGLQTSGLEAVTEAARHRIHDPRPLDPLVEILQPSPQPTTRLRTRRYERFRSEVWRAIDPLGRRWGVGDAAEFDDWLSQRNRVGCTRAAHLVVLSRPWLTRRFIDVRSDPARFQSWSRAKARRHLGFDPFGHRGRPRPGRKTPAKARRGEEAHRSHRLQLISRIRRRILPPRERPPAAPEAVPVKQVTPSWDRTFAGLNLVGPFRAESGLGEVARASLGAVRLLGTPFTHVDVSAPFPSRHSVDAGLSAETGGQCGDVNLLHINPAELLQWSNGPLRHRIGGRFNVGAWFWESAAMPAAHRRAFHMVDELWVASSYLRDVFGQYGRVPVHVVGTARDLPASRRVDRAPLGLEPDHLVFCFVYDAFSAHHRKNPMGSLEAFIAAFGPKFEGVRFVLKVSNLDKFPEHRRAILGLAERHPAITIIDRYLERDGVLDLIAASDVYVSLHTAEGFGLTLLEAMALGTPTICTGFSGNMDFTDERNSWLVGYELTRLDAAVGPYPAGSVWAAPRVEEAAEIMRHVARHRDEIGHKAALARRDALEAASLERYADRLRPHLARVL